MERLSRLLFFLFVGTMFVACSDDADNELSQETNFLSFSFKEYNVQGQIDIDTKTIYIKLPAEVTDASQLTPEFTVSDGAIASINRLEQISGTTTMDFNEKVLYTVSDPTYTVTSRWRVIATNNDYTASYGLGNFLSESWSNEGKCNFYYTQQNTGEFSSRNCGPACATMVMKWYDPTYSGRVEDARNYAPGSCIDGGVDWYPRDIFNFLYDNGAENIYWWDFSYYYYYEFVDEIIRLLRQGDLCVVCINNADIREQTAVSKGYHTHRYYPGGNGHFLVIKGYCVVNGRVWFKVHDPWSTGETYADGKLLGEDRYYDAYDVAYCTDWNIWTIVIPPAGQWDTW
ncbi:MAG: hypothetical protein IJL29_09570 [Prevotella sp.]|nr:hypothetical protein [Prevotella sp.]MBQ6033244.1 hypothetical protein [Prevotella sp.]MBQ6658300.1 hypothetical protein [Prevotella sp.]MBQ7716304.1 hypothetical protein [Prevotella sp.]MBQ9571519.1 hypothetical protein [Prevotella sp.]